MAARAGGGSLTIQSLCRVASRSPCGTRAIASPAYQGVDDRPEWQAAEALLLAVELGGPTIFAPVGTIPALNAGPTLDAFQILPSARPPST
jgi:hypothetical protein